MWQAYRADNTELQTLPLLAFLTPPRVHSPIILSGRNEASGSFTEQSPSSPVSPRTGQTALLTQIYMFSMLREILRNEKGDLARISMKIKFVSGMQSKIFSKMDKCSTLFNSSMLVAFSARGSERARDSLQLIHTFWTNQNMPRKVLYVLDMRGLLPHYQWID